MGAHSERTIAPRQTASSAGSHIDAGKSGVEWGTVPKRERESTRMKSAVREERWAARLRRT